MKAAGYEFDAAIPRFTTGFIFCATISLIWYLVIQSNETGWQYTGLFWMIFTVFLAPAYLGGVSLPDTIIQGQLRRDNNTLHTEPRAARLLETMIFAAAR